MKQRLDGSWEYPPLETEMEEAGFDEMGAYVLKRKNTVAQYIVTRTIMDPCKEMVSRSVEWVARRWWEQEGLGLADARAEYAVSVDGEGESEEEVEER